MRQPLDRRRDGMDNASAADHTRGNARLEIIPVVPRPRQHGARKTERTGSSTKTDRGR